MTEFLKIKRIKVGKKYYDITLIKHSFSNDQNETWICAYVYLPIANKNVGTLSSETYRHNNVVGIDTIHSYNFGMSFDEKEKDAIKQIVNIIKLYNKTVR
jgi:hypothetical protein